MADGKITAPEFIESEKIIAELDKVDKKLGQVLSTLASVSKQSGNFTTQSQGNTILGQRVKLETETSAAIKERVRLYNGLLRTEARVNQAQTSTSKNLASARVESQRLNKETKEQAILLNSQVGAYQKLNLQRTKASKTLRDLIASEKASNSELQKAQANFDGLDAKVKKADAAVRDSTKNVGNYKSAFSGVIGVVRGLVGAFGLIEGLRFGVQFVKDSIQVARQAKGVEFAFKRLGDEGESAFLRIKESSRGLLSDLSIKNSLVELDNFNISLEETDTLMEFLLVRAAQTGKSVDSLRDSLVEGLSKESKLRIDNLGISTAELNNELSKTPNFVKAVANIAKREIAQAGNILDEAANSTETWNVAWENLSLNIGNAFSEIKGSGLAVGIIQNLSDTQEALNVSWRNSGGILERLRINLNRFTESGREANKQLVEENKLRVKSADVIQKQIDAYIALNGALAPLKNGGAIGSGQSVFFGPGLAKEERLLSDINEELDFFKEKLDEGQFSSRAEAKGIQDKIALLEKEKEAILGVSKAKKDTIVIIEGTIAAYERDIAEQKQAQISTAKTAEEYTALGLKIEELQDKIDKLKGTREIVLKVSLDVKAGGLENLFDDLTGTEKQLQKILKDSGFNLDDLKSDADKAIEQFNRVAEGFKTTENFKQEKSQETRDLQARLAGELFGSFANYYNLDIRAFEDLLSGKKALEIDFAATINSVIGSLYESKFIQYEQDQEKNKLRLDAVLNDETASERRKEAARIEFAQREKELNIKKAKAERDALLYQIAIDTAQTVAKILLNAASLSSNPVTAALAANAYAQAAIAAGFGIAQAAIVSGKDLPEFFLGKDGSNNYEGWATVGEKRREVIIDGDGRMEITPNRKTPRFIKRDDIIIPSIPEFINNPTNEVLKRLHQKSDSGNVIVQGGYDQKSMEQMMERVMGKWGNKPIHVNSRVINKTSRTRYFN